MQLLILLSGPVLSVLISWIICLDSEPGDACLDVGMVLAPLLTVISIIASIAYHWMVTRKQKNNEGEQEVKQSPLSAFFTSAFRVLIGVIISLVVIGVLSQLMMF